jgi:hypothetical protein
MSMDLRKTGLLLLHRLVGVQILLLSFPLLFIPVLIFTVHN